MTKHQLAYRKALIDKGLPEVYAHMAAERYETDIDTAVDASRPLSAHIMYGFYWGSLYSGGDFWDAIYCDAMHHETN